MTTGSAFLDRITAAKREAMSSVDSTSRRVARDAAKEKRRNSQPHKFCNALLREDRVNVIAEVKRSSPSVGAIDPSADAVRTAKTYEAAGAAAISVLTESQHFGGKLQDLVDVAAAVRVPLLRKDFTVDAHQIYEAAAAGASAILLIVAALDPSELRDLRLIAEDELGMDALVEAHSAAEVETALAFGATLVGINNRNLQTLAVSLDTSHELAKYITAEKVFISESGIKTRADIDSLKSLGYRAFLVGETLMRATDPSQVLHALANGACQ